MEGTVGVDDGSALDLFIDEMGAEMSVYIADFPDPPPSPLEISRARLKSTATTYNVESTGSPVPYEWAIERSGHVPSQVCFVWDRPTPYAAGHRTLLRKLLQSAGIHPEETSHVWAYPHALTSPPLPTQVALYHDATLSAITASCTRYVVLLGNVPISLWRKELHLSQVVGKFAVWKRRWFVYPLANPIQALVDPTMMSEYRSSIYHLVQTIVADDGMENLAYMCVEKGCVEDATWPSGVYVYDTDGVPWCRAHFRDGLKGRENSSRAKVRAVNKSQQKGML